MKATMDVLDEQTIQECRFSEEKAGFGAVETARGQLPLQAMDLSGRITGLFYRARLNQTFVNAHAVPLEATYIFPMPDRAAVVSFRMKVAGRVIEGVLKERGQAREEYDQAIARGHRAAIAEEERPDIFTMRAGNIPPGEALEVELELSGPLSFSDGEATFRFPLVVAPRYIPGTPLDGPGVGSGTAVDTDAVPDASRISPPILLPGQPNPVRLSLSMDVDPAGLPTSNLKASLHELVIQEQEGLTRVSLRPGTERLNRDFILRYQVGDGSIRSGVSVVGDESGQQGTFSLMVVPPTLGQCGVKPRDVVVVLDRSGSMAGWKMVAARRAAARILDSLTVHDRYGVILFDDRIDEAGGGQLQPANDANRFRAVEFLARVEARGGTQIGPALRRALDYFRTSDPQRERVVMFVTDGEIGNESQVYEYLKQHGMGVRVFSVGVDRAVNASFLQRLASMSGGCCELIESEARLDVVMASVHRRIGSPVLQDVQLRFPGMDPDESTPARLDVFPGVPGVLSGRFRGEVPASVELLGRRADGQEYRETVAVIPTRDPVLRHVWARARVLDLENLLDCGHGGPRLGEQITEFSLRWGVLCRYTAYVAVDRTEVVNPTGEVHQVTQSVEPPEGWDSMAELCCEAAPADQMWAQASWAAPPAEPFGASGSPGMACLRAPMPPAQAGGGWLGASPPGAPPSPPPSPGPASRVRACRMAPQPEACMAPPSDRSGPSPVRPDASRSLRLDASDARSKAPLKRKAKAEAEAPRTPVEELKALVAALESALKRLKNDPGEPNSLKDVEKALDLLRAEGSPQALELAMRGSEALTALLKRESDGYQQLEGWLEKLCQWLGVSRRKSWWKR